MNTIYRDKRGLFDALITPESRVLDVGFWGQGVTPEDEHWPHRLLLARAGEVYGVDLDYDEAVVSEVNDVTRYRKASAESFDFGNERFDVIFAGDLIEHLSNPGLFLDACRRHLTQGGALIITTPNCFNLFNLTMKLTRPEPVVNSDHTCYFTYKTLRTLLEKNGWDMVSVDYLYTFGECHTESIKKKALNILYRLLARITPKYVETLVVTARPARGKAEN